MRSSPVKYHAWRDPLPRQPYRLDVAAIWLGCLLLTAGFWSGVVLLAEKLWP